MCWRDASVYRIRLNQNLEIDDIYIFQWDQPEAEGFQLIFGSRTLIFESLTGLSFELISFESPTASGRRGPPLNVGIFHIRVIRSIPAWKRVAYLLDYSVDINLDSYAYQFFPSSRSQPAA